MIRTATVLTSALLAAAANAQCDSAKAKSPGDARATLTNVAWQGPKADIVDTAVEAGTFKTLVAAVQAAGLVDTLKGEGPFTVFAPTDEAFAKLPAGTVESLLKPENKDQLVAILTYHVVPGRVPAAQAMTLSGAKTVNGQRIDISTSGKTVKVDKATVTAADIKCTNGVIHVIDQVILPAKDSLAETAQSAGKFNTLLAAAKAAGLAEALTTGGPYTVFAPTDQAFAALPEGTVENLLKPENREQLATILKYHIVPGRIYSEDVVKLKGAKTLAGQEASVSVKKGEVRIDGAKVVATDIDAANGVIHVIDAVILPE